MPVGSASMFVNTMRESSKKTAGSSNESKVKIEEAIGSIMKNAEKLLEVVEHVSERTRNLAASTEEMAVSSATVSEAAESIREMLEQLAPRSSQNIG